VNWNFVAENWHRAAPQLHESRKGLMLPASALPESAASSTAPDLMRS
jgi:hypothetical protein